MFKGLFHEWGFWDSPFTSKPLPGSELGHQLLVGREREVKALIRRLTTSQTMPTIEGMNGMGKTSLVNVAAFRCYRHFLTEQKGPIFIPCETQFQLSHGKSVEDLLDEVYFGIAQTLLDRTHEIKGKKLEQHGVIDRWLNAAESKYIEAIGLGVGGSFSINPHSPVFKESGFRRRIHSWLQTIFPNSESGGLVGILDNVELLRGSTEARRFLEELRDPLDQIPGTRWVLCGSHGIVQGLARSLRLQGYLANPIRIGTVATSHALDILISRKKAYKVEGARGYLPFSESSFILFFNIMSGNIRGLLSGIEEYCLWVDEQGPHPVTVTEKNELFKKWLRQTSHDYYASARRFVRPESWRTFDLIVKRGGRVNLSDFKDIDVHMESVLRSAIREFNEANILTDGQPGDNPDDEIYHLTSRGWLIHYDRDQKAAKELEKA